MPIRGCVYGRNAPAITARSHDTSTVSVVCLVATLGGGVNCVACCFSLMGVALRRNVLSYTHLLQPAS